MNIEEERKAFLNECRGMLGNAYYPADTGFASGQFYDPTVQRLFAVWCSAKAHADEMTKSTRVRVYATIFDGREMYAICKEDGEHIYGYLSDPNDTIRWAEDHGYQVVNA